MSIINFGNYKQLISEDIIAQFDMELMELHGMFLENLALYEEDETIMDIPIVKETMEEHLQNVNDFLVQNNITFGKAQEMPIILGEGMVKELVVEGKKKQLTVDPIVVNQPKTIRIEPITPFKPDVNINRQSIKDQLTTPPFLNKRTLGITADDLKKGIDLEASPIVEKNENNSNNESNIGDVQDESEYAAKRIGVYEFKDKQLVDLIIKQRKIKIRNPMTNTDIIKTVGVCKTKFHKIRTALESSGFIPVGWETDNKAGRKKKT